MATYRELRDYFDHGKAARQDHGEPERVSGRRANRRAERTQVVRTSMFGRTKVIRGGREGELRDRWNSR